jgi:[ribosomal protein S5]-alanine N-acetyltransferase
MIDDISDAYVGWLNDPEVTRYSNQRFVTHTRESCLRYVTSFDTSDSLFLIAERIEDKKPIGTLTVFPWPYHGVADVGIMIGERSLWGGGYGQETWSLVVEWLLEQTWVRKVTAGTLVLNKAMLKLMERSGMHYEGTWFAQEIVDGEPVDQVFYARFRNS